MATLTKRDLNKLRDGGFDKSDILKIIENDNWIEFAHYIIDNWADCDEISECYDIFDDTFNGGDADYIYEDEFIDNYRSDWDYIESAATLGSDMHNAMEIGASLKDYVLTYYC